MIHLQVIDRSPSMYGQEARLATLTLQDKIEIKKLDNGLMIIETDLKRGHIFNKAGEYIESRQIGVTRGKQV